MIQIRIINSASLRVVLHSVLMAAIAVGCSGMGTALADTPNSGEKNRPAVAELYGVKCASCHGAALDGGTAPALKGAVFKSKWSRATPSDLANYIRKTMPLGAAEPLDVVSAQELADYILAASNAGGPAKGSPAKDASQSGAPKREDAISREAEVRLRAVANRLTPVTDAMLKEPPQEDWLVWRGDVGAKGFSRLKQINQSNVTNLRFVWSKTLGPGTNGIAPLAHDGVIFVHGGGNISAIAATTGDTIWTREDTAPPQGVRQPRGIALYGDALYASTVDNHTLALDARTGKLLWDYKGANAGAFTAPPFVANGRVFQGAAQCAMKGTRCSMTALNAATGEKLWLTHTVPGEGEPGVESWGGAAAEQRTGAGIWSGSSYDYTRDRIIFGTGNTYSVEGILRNDPKKPSPALYTNSTLQLDAKTGKIVWYYQHFAGDVWDEDWAFERMIIKDPRGSGRTILVSVGKLGILDALDLETGRYLWSIDLGLQDIVTRIDPETGAKTIDGSKTPVAGESKSACPFASGVRNWPATAYDPENSLLFIPMLDACMKVKIADIMGGENTSWVPIARPGSDSKFGRLGAVDLKTGKTAWVDRRRAPEASAILATAGGVIFEGSRDRWFRARQSATGQILWQVRLSDVPSSFPITYMADGKQYVAVVSGGGTFLDNVLSPLTPEVETSFGHQTLWVFAVNEPHEANP